MIKLLFFFVLTIALGQTIFAQKNNKFTFHKEEAVEDFSMKGKTISVEGKLVAVEKGNMIVDYEIYYYIRQSPKIGEVILTKIMLTAPMFKKDGKKLFVTSLNEYYVSKEICKDITITAVDAKNGFYLIEAKNSDGIPFEETIVNEPNKILWGFGEDSNGLNRSGIGNIQIGKFKSDADFQYFKKVLLVQ
jgi:hypothetical protein